MWLSVVDGTFQRQMAPHLRTVISDDLAAWIGRPTGVHSADSASGNSLGGSRSAPRLFGGFAGSPVVVVQHPGQQFGQLLSLLG